MTTDATEIVEALPEPSGDTVEEGNAKAAAFLQKIIDHINNGSITYIVTDAEADTYEGRPVVGEDGYAYGELCLTGWVNVQVKFFYDKDIAARQREDNG